MEKVDDQEKLQGLISKMGSYREMAEALRRQLVALSGAYSELAATQGSLEALKELKPETEILVPVGSDSFVPAKLGSTQKVLVGLGADVAAERTANEAMEMLKSRAGEVENAMKQTSEQLENIEKQMNTLRPEAERLLEKMKKEQPDLGSTGNV